MQTIHFDTRPMDAELVIAGSKATAYFRENIQEIVTEGGKQYRATEYELPLSVTSNIRERFDENKDTWRAVAKRLDYDRTAREVRERRNRLLAQTDKDMSLDRIVSELPSGQSITDFLPFLKALVKSLSSAMAKYRQALRDVPQQEGFPYHVQWPAIEKVGGSDE